MIAGDNPEGSNVVWHLTSRYLTSGQVPATQPATGPLRISPLTGLECEADPANCHLRFSLPTATYWMICASPRHRNKYGRSAHAVCTCDYRIYWHLLVRLRKYVLLVWCSCWCMFLSCSLNLPPSAWALQRANALRTTLIHAAHSRPSRSAKWGQANTSYSRQLSNNLHNTLLYDSKTNK